MKRRVLPPEYKKLFQITLLSIFITLTIPTMNYSLPDNPDPAEVVQDYFKRWQAVTRKGQVTEEEKRQALVQSMNNLLDMERVSRHLVPGKWKDMAPYLRQRFNIALQDALVNDIVNSNMLQDSNLPLQLQLTNEKITGANTATLDFLLMGNNRRLDVQLFMSRNSQGDWKITNLKINKKISLVRHYYSFCKKMVDQYSVPYLIARLGNYNEVILEDFEGGSPGRFPPGWVWKSKDDHKRKPYVVRMEDGNHYLEATDEGESVIIGKNIKWNLREYRYVSFRWRVHRIPKGGDERYGKTVDSAAGIYFIYKKKLGLIPESVKYVWSSTLPVGSAMRRSGVGKPWMVVADSGSEHLGEWRTYVFDAYQAYKDTFGGEPPATAIGIGILSDANSTHSFAYADYDDIRALKTANADSGVKKILEAE